MRTADQRGTVIVSVMVIMALLMLMASTLVNHFLNTESEAVEFSLLESRVYWAMMGHANYMLSRASNQGICAVAKATKIDDNAVATCNEGDDSDIDSKESPTFANRSTASRAGSMQDYLDGDDEIQDGTIQTPGSRLWVYPQQLERLPETEPTPSYNFKITGVVRDLQSAKSQPFENGNLRLDLSVTSDSSMPIFQNISTNIQLLTIGFCVTDAAADAAQPGQFTNIGCTNGTTSKEGVVGIQFIQRAAAIPIVP